MTSRVEQLLSAALHDAGARTQPSPDLFERIQTDIVHDRNRTRRRRLGGSLGALGLVTATLLGAFYQQGDNTMDWWILELIAAIALVAIALVLGPFIKRFGRSYAADVFRSNPGTGKSFIVLTDFAYYLIFSAYILFTTTIDRPRDWSQSVGAEQFQHSVARMGGILLIIGVLHGINLLVLPIIGRLLTLNRRLDQQMRELAERDLDGD